MRSNESLPVGVRAYITKLKNRIDRLENRIIYLNAKAESDRQDQINAQKDFNLQRERKIAHLVLENSILKEKGRCD